jgi:hypothetical protein
MLGSWKRKPLYAGFTANWRKEGAMEQVRTMKTPASCRSSLTAGGGNGREASNSGEDGYAQGCGNMKEAQTWVRAIRKNPCVARL